MKTICDETLTFITPAFLSGADQNEPEIRAASFRGELRWWFRVLGGTLKQETAVFGGVHGKACASAVVVRTKLLEKKVDKTITFSPTSDKGYVYFFADKSGNDKGIHRTAQGHYFAEGTTFSFKVLLRRELAEEENALFRKALSAFLRLGSVGLRATRGCGAFLAGEPLTRGEFAAACGELPGSMLVKMLPVAGELPTRGVACQEMLSGFLRGLRRDTHCSGKHKSAFGYSDGRSRESSALRLRPVRVKEGFLPVVVYTDAACAQPSRADDVANGTVDL